MMAMMMMTWKEMLRKRVMMLSLLMTGIFLIAFWFAGQAISTDLLKRVDPESLNGLIRRFEAGAIILSLGFFFGSFVIAFLSIFSSVNVIAGEAEQGVLQALLPRPIARWQWFLGRWLGYVSLGVIYALLLFAAILFVTDMHAGIPANLGSLLRAFILFIGVVPLLVSVSMLGSCFFSSLGNGVFMVMLFGAGWVGGMLQKVISVIKLEDNNENPTLQMISDLVSLLMPADALQRRMMAELFSLNEFSGLTDLNNQLGPFALFQIPSNWFLLYTSIYICAALGMGLYKFQRKDL